jgi:transcriptional regulator with XRE-family HTH domain
VKKATVTVVGRKAPSPIDKHVGSRVRMRRRMLAMSQAKLGDALGVSFQQVQKYESGANRIGASRLQHISHILQAPVSFFFEEATPEASATRRSDVLPSAQMDEFVSSPEGLRLIEAFMRIKSSAMRREIVRIVQVIPSDAG